MQSLEEEKARLEKQVNRIYKQRALLDSLSVQVRLRWLFPWSLD